MKSAEVPAILIVDDDEFIVGSLGEFLKTEGHEVDSAVSFDEALAALERRPYNIVITDVNMPGADGFELLRVVRRRYPATVVILITGYGTIDSAVEAIKMGAYDYLTKPIHDDEIRLVVERSLNQQSLIRENQTLRKQLDERYGLDRLVGTDHQMLKVYDLIEAVADASVTVLIQGPSGTGKSLVARVIHHRSERCPQAFVEVSCGAIPEALLESELFGHVRGAFTGAVSDKEGKFKAADGGTLFLDEISAASPALQVKLLRFLQEKRFEAVGSNRTESADVRVILASNIDLEQEMAQGRFRQDLFYRINVVAITLPTLAERIGDIPLLAETFLKQYCAKTGRHVLGFTEETLNCLQRYDWPGNVRELENVVERAVVLTKGSRITVHDLPPKLLDRVTQVPPMILGAYQPLPLKKALEGPEKQLIEAALRASGWNRQATAEILQINRTTLYKKMKRYGLTIDPSRSLEPATADAI
jgi:DNA-binding NtrC family response regulator